MYMLSSSMEYFHVASSVVSVTFIYSLLCVCFLSCVCSSSPLLSYHIKIEKGGLENGDAGRTALLYCSLLSITEWGFFSPGCSPPHVKLTCSLWYVACHVFFSQDFCVLGGWWPLARNIMNESFSKANECGVFKDSRQDMFEHALA